MRLKLKFDCQYGFKELYMTETDLEHDVDVDLMQVDYAKILDGSSESDYLFIDHLDDIYEQFKTRPLDLYEETSNSDDFIMCGDLAALEECIREDAYHNIFKKLVNQYPGYSKFYNCRLELIDTEEEPIIHWADDTTTTVTSLHELKSCADLPNAMTIAEEKSDKNRVDIYKQNYQKYNIDLESSTVCSMLGISRQTLANWVKAGRIHRLPNGKYNKEEIKNLTKEN